MGLVETARKCFRLPRSELFGVRAVTLTLFFLTLLSQTTVEAAGHLRRFEFGPVIGTGRALAIKTLRRKLAELVEQPGARRFHKLLVKRWVEQASEPSPAIAAGAGYRDHQREAIAAYPTHRRALDLLQVVPATFRLKPVSMS